MCMQGPKLNSAVASVCFIWILILGCTLAYAQAAPQSEPAPDVPDAIQAPAGLQVVVYAHATGFQIYTCQSTPDGKFAWTLKAPDAELHDRKDKVIGQHS